MNWKSPKLVDSEGFFDLEMRVEAKKEGLNLSMRAKQREDQEGAQRFQLPVGSSKRIF